MTRLSTVHSLVHFNNLTSPVLSQQTNTGNVQSCYPGLLCEKFWRRILISVRQQLKSCMTVSGGGECCDSQSDSVGEFTCPGTSGAAAPSQPSHNVLCNIIVSGPPPLPLPPSLIMIPWPLAQADLLGSEATNRTMRQNSSLQAGVGLLNLRRWRWRELC